jgi:hypothetical protein
MRETPAKRGRVNRYDLIVTVCVFVNISGNSPFGTPTLMKNAERYEW